MDIFSQIFSQISSIFKKMSAAQRTNFFLLLTILISVVVFISFWAGRQEYGLLYSNLANRDAAAIKSKLDELNVENKVQGNSIYVSAKEVYDLRLMLAEDGLPNGSSSGYELFDRTNFGMTDYLQNLTYKRALEGELCRTINSLNGINSSRVHLSIPKQTLFKQDRTHPSASIVLNVSSGALGKGRINGIVYLVASSVESLSTEHITVLDNRGNLLFSPDDAGAHAGVSSRQLDQQKNVEAYLKNKAESMLLAILGPGKAIVRVNAVMDFDQIEKTAEIYDPDSAVPRKEVLNSQVSSEKSGAETEDNEESAAGNNAESSQEKTTTDYEINRTIERLVGAVGKIEQLSISVVVDGKYEKTEAKEGDESKLEYVPRTEEEKQTYKQLVMNAVGFSAQRGDEIVVTDAAFDTSYFDQENEALASGQKKDFILKMVRQSGIIIVFLLAFFFLRSMLKKISGAAGPANQPQGHAKAAGGAYTQGAVAEGTRSSVGMNLQQAVAQNPERTAQLINEWLNEE
ncbi:MAG: flagellar M-ring protein FliF [Candidatus Omnitrophota bacterium]|nr:MAG: flagellar M-ring protein FliF [Candidatus Omnitrophota bacterium]